MAKKAIQTDSEKHRTTGFARSGLMDSAPGTPAQTVHDGDTVNVQLDGNLGLRLLGIDTPEISFSLPAGQFAGFGDWWSRTCRLCSSPRRLSVTT